MSNCTGVYVEKAVSMLHVDPGMRVTQVVSLTLSGITVNISKHWYLVLLHEYTFRLMSFDVTALLLLS